ncbi:uncharacterized protein KIAA1958-like [Mytilus edulis]|uniref:uncharacterized protein KIAA1958-like n=1 Tax=Mytilus edulis TaxID=6550 RepID=UPI0039EE454B
MASTRGSKRFATTTNEEIDAKRLNMNAENTLKANRKCAYILRDYLQEKQQDDEFEKFDCVRLNETLCHFYVDLRKGDGERYKASSLESIRHGINRYLKAPPHSKTFDIVKDSPFNDSNANFKAVLAESKRFGLGDVEHFPVINEVDRETLYTSMYLSSTTPTGLANKVQFDIRLFFCRRGIENMHSMTKCTFTIKTDIKTGLKYVTKAKDELTKNHRESDKELVSGVMPESPGSVYCPVASYENYIRRLHPSNDRLWQKPLDSFSTEADVWYCNMPLGEKKLSTFMSELSKKCKLSIVYTNHSIRATGATVLSQNMYGSAQIMAVTGHKSVQSLTTYLRVDTNEKIKMGKTLSDNLVQRAVIASNHTCNRSKSDDSGSFMEQIQDIDIGDILGDFDDNGPKPIQYRQTTTCMQSTKPQSQIFYGNVTVIHNLTINK